MATTTERKSLFLPFHGRSSMVNVWLSGIPERETDAVCHGAHRFRSTASHTANPVASAGTAAEARACQTLPAARPDKSPAAVGGRTRRASRPLRPLLAALDLSALIGGPLGAHTPPGGPEDAHVLLLNRHSETYARLWKHARGHARRKNVCCLLRVSLAPLHPSSLINSTFARACKNVILII